MPSVLSTLSTIAQIAAPIVQLTAGVQEAGAVRGEAEVRAVEQEFAAGAELYNADIARQEAKLAQARAKIEIGRKRTARESLISEQQVLFAVSGVRVDVGTPLVVMQDTFEELELDILITQFNADVEAQFLESEARQAELRAQQRRGVAAQERTAGRIRAGKTLLETVGTVAQKFPMPDFKTTSPTEIVGGRGGKIIQTKQFGTTWSPYK